MINNITPTIKYIGVDDLDIDLFESQYEVPNGMAYNSGGLTLKRLLLDASLHISLLITWSLIMPLSLLRLWRNIQR